jgi:kynureninase
VAADTPVPSPGVECWWTRTTASVSSRCRFTPAESFGGFLALRTPKAGPIQSELRDRDVLTDSRGPYLRLGPAP